MAKELIVNASLPEIRIALVEDGEIQELLIERASGRGIVGNIYKGRVTRVLPGMQAAFVDIGLEKAAFLYVDDIYSHSEILDEDAGGRNRREADEEGEAKKPVVTPRQEAPGETAEASAPAEQPSGPPAAEPSEGPEESLDSMRDDEFGDEDAHEFGDEDEDHEEEEGDEPEAGPDSDDEEPVHMSAPPEGGSPEGTVPPGGGSGGSDGGRRRRRGRRGRGRRGGTGGGGGGRREAAPHGDTQAGPGPDDSTAAASGGELPAAHSDPSEENLPEPFVGPVEDVGHLESDRTMLDRKDMVKPEEPTRSQRNPQLSGRGSRDRARRDLKQRRDRDRTVPPRGGTRGGRGEVNIQDLLKEGQEVIVQVAKDPIAQKGARLTCHVSLAGRHLVCMPTIEHVGVSRRIDNDTERRRLRDFVERHRPKGMGFIVRTASGGRDLEKLIQQDIEYLVGIWDQIKAKAAEVSAPAMVYEDLTPILRAIRDWVNEDVAKIIIDSRYHYNEVKDFADRFMPSLRAKVELYQGDIPIFDAYGISTELQRAFDRKVWLKSGGYIVIDQAEALVAIDVNTGRYVGKRSLEDTILKTNIEAVKEIAYQLRLRNFGGIIILDLIDMEKEENKQKVYRALEEALKIDRARPTIMKISDLGLIEMTRKRTRDTFVRTMCEPCAFCEGKGFLKSRQTVAYELLREIEREGTDRDVKKIMVQAHPDVIDILAIDEAETLSQLEKRYRKEIYLQAVPDAHQEQFEVTGDKLPRKASSMVNTREKRTRGGRDRSQRSGRSGRSESRDESRRDEKRESPPRIEPVRRISPRTEPVAAEAVNENSGGEQMSVEQPKQERPKVVIIPRATPLPRPEAPKPSVEVQPAFQSQGQANGQGQGQGQGPGPGQGPGQADEDRQPDFGGPRPLMPASESVGNFANDGGPRGPSSPGGHGEDDEEDRLAFLRAQAAQDAALANLGAGGSGAAAQGRPHSGGRGGSGGGGGGGGGGGARGGKRGGRGTRFRGGGPGHGRGHSGRQAHHGSGGNGGGFGSGL